MQLRKYENHLTDKKIGTGGFTTQEERTLRQTASKSHLRRKKIIPATYFINHRTVLKSAS
jgi:hypothetical protein